MLCVSPAFADVPVAADLTNLTYTATGDLSATLVDPAPNSASRTIASKILVSTVAGAGVELKVDNRIISTKQIGLRTVNKKTGETRYEYFGVVLAEGPNVVELTPLGGAGSRGPTSRYTLYGPGRPAHFTFSLDRALRADGGNTISTLSIGASDRWNNPAMPGAIIKLNITAGDLHFLVASPAELGQPTHYHLASAVEIPIASGGLEQIQLSGGLLPGEVTLQLTAADTVTTERFYVEPNLRKPFVAGLVTVGAGPVPGFAGMPAAVPDGQQTREGRIAMFATGTVFNDVLATAAYDTANVLQQTLQGPYVTDPYDRPFQTYGDTSYLHDDALSTDHLYARFDRNQSSFMWGEFRPDTGSTDPDGAYHLLIDGAKLELGTDRTRVVAFTANNQFAYARQQFNPTGLSMSGQILHPDIVVGSDIVTLVALDSRTGAVLNQTIMVNNVDYTIDYSTGMLRFINIPLPYDDHFNPQVIQVQYEYGGVGVASETTGGRASVLLDSKGALQLNVGYVNDFSGVANFSLFEQSLQGTTHGGAWSIAHVESNGAPLGSLPTASQTGSEIHATFSQVSGTNRLAFEFETASADFDNPFGGFATPGLTSYNLDLKHLFNPDSDIAINFNLQHNISASGSENQSQASAIYHHVWKNGFTIKAGLQANDVSNVASSISGGTVT
ncbi:MAG TPA: hypothetical protein VK216_01940, partial [Magnetospirillaceae bacterium]|nr:hypothetical protein [Magnetospirillaceae bacterium]